MMRFLSAILLSLLALKTYALSQDKTLEKVIEVYDLGQRGCEVDSKHVDDKLVPLGKILFESKILSGSGDTSCATCHLDEMALTDGLPMSIGVGGGDETGDERIHQDGVVVPRNAFTLLGRASPKFETFFWDGSVQERDGIIVSPVGDGYQTGFKSALSVASIMPLLARDEFLGKRQLFFSNRHIDQVDDQYYFDRFVSANQLVKSVIKKSNNEHADDIIKVLEDLDIDNLSLPLIGSSLASFIAKKNSDMCSPSRWDNYLSGDLDALSEKQKNGAIIFFGKGRCAACHNGPHFSDFNFHSIGVPQGGLGPYLHKQDIGRGAVTFNLKDRHKFRTPPLIKVSQTAPYGHSGAFESLEEIVQFHINPIPFFSENGWTSRKEMYSYGKLLSSRSDILGFIDIQTDEELSSIVDFLNAL